MAVLSVVRPAVAVERGARTGLDVASPAWPTGATRLFRRLAGRRPAGHDLPPLAHEPELSPVDAQDPGGRVRGDRRKDRRTPARRRGTPTGEDRP